MSLLGKNPISNFLDHQPFLVLDGGLATALETRGCDLNDPLWSAKILLEDPDPIREVHMDFLAAGADCIATASYQASFPGLARRGLDGEAIEGLLELSVELATDARDQFWAEKSNRHWGASNGAEERGARLKPLVAASVGPFGAFLADGSEYSGRYGLSEAELYEFHRRRWITLSRCGPDLMACETIPSLPETRVLLRLIQETPETWSWVSFSCRDAGHLSDGTPIRDAVEMCQGVPGVAAVGVNCTPPELMAPLVGQIRDATDKPILLYPNSGESYEAGDKVWRSTPSPMALPRAASMWRQMGVAGIGGCCRVGPEVIRQIRAGMSVN